MLFEEVINRIALQDEGGAVLMSRRGKERCLFLFFIFLFENTYNNQQIKGVSWKILSNKAMQDTRIEEKIHSEVHETSKRKSTVFF